MKVTNGNSVGPQSGIHFNICGRTEETQANVYPDIYVTWRLTGTA